MTSYQRTILTTSDLLQKYKDAGLIITDDQKVVDAINEIGYYRLKGYSYHLLNPLTHQYSPGILFDTILNIYQFDAELRSLLFEMTCRIEVALRARFCEAVLQAGDPLIYLDPSIFKDKKIFWQNTGIVASEIARSNELFIKHNYANYDGQIPVWAVVEILSFSFSQRNSGIS